MAGTFEGFMFFRSYYEGAKELDDTDRLALYDAIIEYALNDKEPNISGVAKACFTFVKPVLDKSKSRAEAGRRGGQSNRKPEDKQTSSKEEAKSDNQEAIKDKGINIKDKDKGLRNKKEGSNGTSGSSGSMGSDAQAPTAPPIITLPLTTGEDYPVTPEDVDHWSELYPAVDVTQELRKMAGWLESNPRKRKTPKGIRQFITGWLAREQDKGRARASPGDQLGQNRSYDIRDLEELSHFDLPDVL